jgi:phage I-like protein
MKPKTSLTPMIAALSMAVTHDPAAARQSIKLLPAGEFRARDGRPANAPAWIMNQQIAVKLIAAASARQTDYVVDYEHQTLNAAVNGLPAPASGWWSQLEWREGDGLYITDMRWTAAASAYIAAEEYRFISPVFSYGKNGHVQELLHVALTNNPALDELPAVSVAALSRLLTPIHHQENPVDRETLIATLGLAATATDADITVALTALKTKADGADATIAALSATQIDPAKFVSVDVMRDLQTQVAALTTQAQVGQADQLVVAALSDGRLLPAQEAWARDLAKTNIAALSGYLATAPKIAALSGNQTGGKPPADQSNAGDGLDEVTLAVCKAMGNSAADVQKTLATNKE